MPETTGLSRLQQRGVLTTVAEDKAVNRRRKKSGKDTAFQDEAVDNSRRSFVLSDVEVLHGGRSTPKTNLVHTATLYQPLEIALRLHFYGVWGAQSLGLSIKES